MTAFFINICIFIQKNLYEEAIFLITFESGIVFLLSYGSSELRFIILS